MVSEHNLSFSYRHLVLLSRSIVISTAAAEDQTYIATNQVTGGNVFCVDLGWIQQLSLSLVIN